jgi:hypothetical protein
VQVLRPGKRFHSPSIGITSLFAGTHQYFYVRKIPRFSYSDSDILSLESAPDRIRVVFSATVLAVTIFSFPEAILSLTAHAKLI